ncbi:FAD-binding protein [Aquimarina spongiae]|uniref:FAD binding domain-containing protein n=1 Tax=Aquimarina spongiae TaxID=570521 RepID=A0A1M6BBG4_9FLAO|nr:FAD-binding protein [Aquimarina spongiae]SHI46055.1 FAD binding domain-containing protein [Aquimarina spongiae]
MATTKDFQKTQWDTLHRNGPFPLKLLQVTELEGKANMPSSLDRYNDAAKEIQRLITEAHNNGHGFRPYGSRWSMSSIAHQKDRMHFNSHMNIDLPVQPGEVHSSSPYHHSNLFFFQCGNTIKEISKALGAHGKSLKTSGASNGQTIAGCIATGVHGSALDVGSIQDYVVGLNLIVGPKDTDIVYLERKTKPALKDSFAQKIKARVIRDDALFNAAVVGLGSFGFIHGVLIEAENRFLLKRYVRKIDKQTALKLSDTMDFKNSTFKIDGEVDQAGKPLRPYHYKVFINPYINDSQYVVEAMYKKPYRTPYPDPFTTIEKSIYRDLIYLLIKISERFPKAIPWFIKRLENAILPDVNEETTGTLYETFWDAPYQGPAFACSFGVDHKHSSKALKILTDLTKNEGPIPGIFAMRFVKKSEATLAFTKFPITCVIEIDGVLWKKSNKLMSLKEFSARMIQVLKQNNIPFTIHWGKNAAWTFPGLVDHMFGSKAKEWEQQRARLLSPEMAVLFSNKFLKDIGLSKTPPPTGGGPTPIV